MTQRTTHEQLEDGIDLSQLFQTHDTAQGLNLESNSFSFEGLFQQQGPFQKYDEQHTREQALSKIATPTAAGIRDSWQSVARERDREADQVIAEGSTQAPEPCRFQDLLPNQESVAEEPPKNRRTGTRHYQRCYQEANSISYPPCSIVVTPSVLGQVYGVLTTIMIDGCDGFTGLTNYTHLGLGWFEVPRHDMHRSTRN